MSTAYNPDSPIDQPGGIPDQEIRIYGHGTLFYWWPVWALCFVLALLTYIDGHVMAVVPEGTQVAAGQEAPGTDKSREVLVTPEGTQVATTPGSGRCPEGASIRASPRSRRPKES